MRQLNKQELNRLKHLYLYERQSINKLRKEFKLQFDAIKKILIESGIPVRTQRESRLTYQYNENYFSEINTHDKAYWLGFIYADGFITKKTNGSPVFGLTLGEKEPLEKLNSCLGSNKPIKEYKKTNSYSGNSVEYKLAFCSPKMVEDLERWGCVENKTFKLKFPTFLSEELMPHFIRGYFDGDGSVFLHIQKAHNKEYIMLGVQFCGIESFLRELAKHISAETCVYKDKRKSTDCWKIQLQSNVRSLELYHYMYHNAGNIYLSRKKDKFEDFIKDRGSTTTISNPTYVEPEYKSLCYIED